MWGETCVKSWSKMQPTVALSSGEVELGAVVRGFGEGLGFLSLLGDFGWKLPLAMKSDATAAIGIVTREGLGKVRHLATADLWIQQRVRRGELQVGKWPGADNPADLQTKGVPRPTLDKLVALLGFQDEEGRSSLAPALKEGAGRTMGSSGETPAIRRHCGQ